MHTGTDKPTVKSLMKYRGKISPHWYDLGIQLLQEKYFDKLKVIQKNSPHDVESSCSKMLECWLDVDPKANWNMLIDALKEIGQNALADQIKQEILKGETEQDITLLFKLSSYFY